ncbi:uncharacterized protein LOC129603341 [Betta splendens]|uniref:Uncharacterized protein LOC129603341 n=1 Tax=Betta splendens TaxID=158456 RepID=A0A9W2XE20_BETSP|nr:uncharacterized protein LOC129603341 [Betta splendens]
MHGGFHPKSSNLRLYASRKKGGRGLVSVRATIQDKTSKIHKYIMDKALTDDVLSKCLRQWRTEDEMLEEGPSWEDKPLHRMYHRNITEVADLNKSYQWLERAGLKDIVYRNICAEYGLETPRSKWETPPKVVENERAKILWDFQIQTDRMVIVNQPDIVVVDKEQRKAVVVDVAIPSNGNIRKKEHEKLEKYQGLREELEKAWKVKATVVPVVIGALGAVTPKLEEWLQQIPEKHPTSQSRKVQSWEQQGYCAEPSSSLASGRGPELGKWMRPTAEEEKRVVYM